MSDQVLTTAEQIARICLGLSARLLAKNKLYGDSALDPQRIASNTHPLEQIAVRIDDKLSRLKNMGGLVAVLAANSPDGEDVIDDLLGYLVLAKVGASHREWGRDGQLHAIYKPTNGEGGNQEVSADHVASIE